MQPGRPRPLPLGAVLAAGFLLAVPLVALAVVPLYSKDTPRLWGFPFFYWYQFLWVFLASGFTWGAYLVVQRARRDGAVRDGSARDETGRRGVGRHGAGR